MALAVEVALQHDRVMIPSERHLLVLDQPRGVFHQGLDFGIRVYLRDQRSNPKTVLVGTLILSTLASRGGDSPGFLSHVTNLKSNTNPLKEV